MFCPNCGKQIADGSKFCPYCGTNTSQASETAKNKKAINPRNHRKLFLIIAIVCLVVTSLFIFAYPKVTPIVFKGISNYYMNKANEQPLLTEPNSSSSFSLDSIESNLSTAIKLNPKNIEAKEEFAAVNAINGDLGEVDKQVNDILEIDANNEYAKLLKSLLSEGTTP